jgi:hypothetical protein
MPAQDNSITLTISYDADSAAYTVDIASFEHKIDKKTLELAHAFIKACEEAAAAGDIPKLRWTIAPKLNTSAKQAEAMARKNREAVAEARTQTEATRVAERRREAQTV